MPERMLRLLSLLQSRREWSGADLARRLEVTDRTVRRDIERLRGLGYPVDASTGVAGGYRLVSGADLPPLLLEDDEAVAIAVGLRTASAGLEDAAVRALAKLEQILPKRLRGKVNAVGDATSALPQRGAVDISVLGVVAAACRDHELLRFDYSGRDGRPGARRVEPRNLVAWYGRWYLIAFDTDRADWRTFRLDRHGRELVALGADFTLEVDPDLLAHLEKAARRLTSKPAGFAT
jgi:predicted DNA-binding transcriptional regulator YafY